MSRLPNQMGQTSATCCVDLQDADEAVDEAFASPPDADAMVAYQASADGAVLGEKKKVRKQQRLHMHGYQCVDGAATWKLGFAWRAHYGGQLALPDPMCCIRMLTVLACS